jgi:hypothetical protein
MQEEVTDRQMIVNEAYLAFLARAQDVYESFFEECNGVDYENISVRDVYAWLVEGMTV